MTPPLTFTDRAVPSAHTDRTTTLTADRKDVPHP